MRPLRILFFSTTFGAGHVKAAEAIIEAIKEIEPSAEIIHEDAIELINRVLNTFIRTSYIRVIKRAPKMWGKFYNKARNWTYDSLFQKVNNIGQRQLLDYIVDHKPDVIVSTYPTVSGGLANLKIKGQLTIPLVTVITDYTIHGQWIHPGVDLNIVGCKKIYEGLVKWGIDPSRIQVSGIPVNPHFEYKLDKTQIRMKIGLSPDRITFLIMGGAYGVLDKAQALCSDILNIERPIQAIIVCGKDNKLYHSIDEIVTEARNPVVRYGFVDNIDELMTAADVIITKAGGLTVSESLSKHLPMIIYKPIPGQEEDNALYIQEVGAGCIVNNYEEFKSIILELINHPEKIQEMSQNAAKVYQNHSAERAAKAILKIAKQ